MKIWLFAALLPLAGCVTPGGQMRAPSPTEIIAADPTSACMTRVQADAFIITNLAAKIGVGRPGAPSLEMLSDKSTPSPEQKQALSQYAAERQRCLDSGDSYRRQNMPAGVVAAADESSQATTILLAKLYADDITFGQFNTSRLEVNARMRERLRGVDRDIRQDQMQDDDRRRAAAATALQSMQQQLLLNQQIQQNNLARQPLRTPITTNCQRIGNQTNCQSW